MKILIILTLIGCTLADTDLCAANDAFSKKLLQAILREKSGNTILSSFSLFTPLAQLVFASGGNTRAEILRALTIPVRDIDCTLKRALPSVNKRMHLVKGINYTDANKIYIQDSLKLNYHFKTQTSAIFGSLIEPVNFNSPLTVKYINKWIAEQTNNKITRALNPEVPLFGTQIMLVNTVYFKAEWASPFDIRQTWPDIFFTSERNSIKIPFMHHTTTYKYGKSAYLDAQLIELPYKANMAKLIIVVPNSVDGLFTVLDKLDSATLRREKKLLIPHFIDLSLPKFKIETEMDLKIILGDLGVHRLFANANLTNLLANNEPVYISAATQKAFIEIDEAGTEAGAVNIIQGMTSSGVLPEKVNINRPFYFELNIGSVKLFSGVFTHCHLCDE